MTMETKETKWVLIDRMNLEKTVDALRIFGSIKIMELTGIYENGKRLSYDQLRTRLHSGYWKSDKYIIKKCEVERNPRY